jgi:O-antigen/teichoic acid export membrane protein
MTALGLIQQTVLAPVSTGSLRFFAAAGELNQLNYYLVATFKMFGKSIALFSCLAFIVALGLCAFSMSTWLLVVGITLLFCVISSANIVLDGVQNAARQRAIVALHQGIGQWLKPICVVIIVLAFWQSSAMVLVGFTIGSLIVAISQLYFFNKKVQRIELLKMSESREVVQYWIDKMWKYGWPFITWGVFTWLQISSDRWSLQFFQTSSDVGKYAVLYQLGFNPIAIATAGLLQLVAPIAFSRAGSGTDKKRLQGVYNLNVRLALITIGFTLLCGLMAFLFHGEIFSLLVGKEYQSVSCFLPIMVLSGGFFASGQLFALNQMSENKTSLLITPKIVTACVGTVLYVLSAYLFGLVGVICSSLIFSIIYFGWMFILNRHCHNR